MVKVAVLGYGTVGSGVVEVIETNRELIAANINESIEVAYVLDIRDFPNDPIQKKITHDFNDILNDESVSVVCEVMGGVNPAYEFTKQLLQAGKSVCTSNKELVANHGAELLSIAREKKVNYLFEASCGGGIPIICTINSALAANKIDEITGILNGTTNYILTEMAEKGESFEAALKKAQEMGYAERNPEADVEGHDACRKIAILSSLAFDKILDYKDIYTEGITKITKEDMLYAAKLGMAVKLLAMSEIQDEQVYSMVAPFLVHETNPLSGVKGVFNAVFVHGNMLGDSMYYGSGAGKLPTASAVVGDVIDAVRHKGRTVMTFASKEALKPAEHKHMKCAFFVRVPESALEEAKEAFGEVEVVRADGLEGECGVVTRVMTEADFEERAGRVSRVLNRIRIK